MIRSSLRLAIAMLAGLTALPAAASVTVRVDISRQVMSVHASSGEVYNWRISTGRIGYATPSGVYQPQRLERFWRSRKYGMAPMPYAVFFRGGYAIHGTSEVGRLGRPASHGCIRLSPGNAATLFGLVQRHSMGGTRIIVSGRHASLAPARPALHRPTVHRPALRPRPVRVQTPVYYPTAPGGWYEEAD